ncbi:MAG: hypothetical protein P9F19_00210 [Candidatus Contendobacter sp.]|nr:hypothetical protein [Candidatus Contendobacter sp.]
MAGTGLALHYRSNRVLGRRSSYTVVIHLSGNRVPASLKRIEYVIGIAGLLRTGTVPAQPNQQMRFPWSGRDAYGRQLIGGQPASVTVKYVYDGVYYGWEATFGVRNFGLPGDVVISRDWARQEITLTRRYTIPLSALTPTVGLTDLRRGGLGGWTLDLHQVHDPVGQVLYQGDGKQRKPEPSLGATTASFLGRVVTAFAGTGAAGFAGDGGPATQAQLNVPTAVAVAPDGGVLIADAGNHRIRRVDPGGRIATVAGTGEDGFAGDGGPATQAQLHSPTAVAVAPDGGILIADTGNRVIRRIGPDGRITTVAGFYWDGGAGIAPAQRASGGATTTALGLDGDGGPATQARLSSPRSVAAARDGSVLIADPEAQVIRRVSPDGMITTFAGTGEAGFAGDGGPATQAQLNYPTAVIVAPDGGVWIADAGNHRIRRVGADGRIATMAGTGVAGGFGEGDGGSATEAPLANPHHLALTRDGALLIAEGGDARIRRVGSDGIITTWAGSVLGIGDPDEGGLAARAVFSLLGGLAVAPDGGVLVAEAGTDRVRRIGSGLPKFDGRGFAIAAADGSRIDRFDANGRHQFSADPWTGAVRRTFSYDPLGRLRRMADADDNAVTVERDFDGNPTALVGPFGQRTELGVDRNGYLSSVVNPAGETWRMSYTADGLLTEFTDPRGQTARFSYDTLGRLSTATDRAGGAQTLTRVAADSRGFETTRVSGQGRTTRYRLEQTPSGGQRREVVSPAGLSTTTRKQPDGTLTTVTPDGTTLTTGQGPDPRFGMQAPLTPRATLATGERTATVTATQTVTPGDPAQPPGIVTRTDTVTVNGRTITTVYTTADRSAVTTTPTGRTRTRVLDDQGRFAQARIPGLAPLDLARDGRGRPSQLRQSDGAETRALTFGYGLDGYLQTVTDPLGRVTALTRDPVGRVLRQTDPDGRATEFRYDANGNLAALTPPGRLAHVFAYTPVDLTEQYAPPAAGLATPQTRYSYNRDRQLTRIDRPDGQALTVAYDTAGRRSTLTLPTGVRSYGYDPSVTSPRSPPPTAA